MKRALSVAASRIAFVGVNVAVLALVALACKTERPEPAAPRPTPTEDESFIVVDAPEVEPPAKGPRELESLPIAGDQPVLVARGKGDGVVAVYLGGVCTHPRASMEVLRRAASEHGTIVALQGDLPCPEAKDPTLRKFSTDTALLEKRIGAAIAAAGGATSSVTVIGYSQGAERAEWLANRGAAAFTRFVLVASPITPEPARYPRAEGVVAMAGAGDVREHMAIGARRLWRSGIPAVYIEIPSHGHSELDRAAAESLAGAFEWLEGNAKARGQQKTPERKAMLKRPGR